MKLTRSLERENRISVQTHQFVNEMKGNYLQLIDYFGEEEVPALEITVKNIP